ncbi:MAG: riboflavin kinase, partial [Bacteroidota bacterium]
CELAPTLGFDVEEIPEKDIDAIAVSSTRIRTSLLNAEVELARNLLGYPYALEGVVIKGRQIGRTIGYPTANLAIADPDKLIPANGVYAVWVECEGRRFKGAMSIGHRPTFDAGERSIEVHVLQFSGDLYGKSLRVECMYHLRPELKFDAVDHLIRQMQQDCLKADQLLVG